MDDFLPLVSIIIPSFNQGKYIERTLHSIFQQDYPNIEIIVIDNCSTDMTPSILADYCDQIDLLIIEPDKGQSDAINKGFSLASGSYLTWLNSDDFYSSAQSISSVIDAFRINKSIKFIYGNVSLYYESKKPKLLKGKQFSFQDGFHLIDVPIPQQCSVLHKSIFTSGIRLNSKLHYLLDRDFFLRISEKYPILYLNRTLACFRQHIEAKSFSSFDRWINEYLFLYEFYYSPSTPFQNLPPKNITFTSLYFQISILHLRDNRVHKFILYLFMSLSCFRPATFLSFLKSKITSRFI
tara:strand:+ start:4644 stop:5528 length:885 start_codon:yes stop_codon:yes gene_type:complete